MDLQMAIAVATLLSVIIGWGVAIGSFKTKLSDIEAKSSVYISSDTAKILIQEAMNAKLNGFATKDDIKALEEILGIKLEVMEKNIAEINNALCEMNGRLYYAKKKSRKDK